MNPKFVPMSEPDFGSDEVKQIVSTFKTNWLSQGKITHNFEDSLSKYLSSSVSVVNNGTSALLAALLAHGIKPGDKIIVPGFTFIATSSAPKLLGAKIIPADIDPFTLNITAESIEKIVKKNNVKAVIVVDVAGLPVDLDPIIELSKKYNFILIEDAAEALGSEYKGKKLGSFNHTTIFSFHIAKLITTIEGGCIASKNKKIISKISKIRNHGSSNKKYVHDLIGSNFRTTDLQSALGLVQLKKIDQYIEKRNTIAMYYKKNITSLEFQKIPSYVTRHSYMLFFAKAKTLKKKNKILSNLIKNNFDARNSWLPIHMQPCNIELQKFKLLQSENIFQQSLTLPIFNTMNLRDAKRIVKTVNNF
jgi:perosamine synthetase